MAGRRSTRRELEEIICRLAERMEMLESSNEDLRGENAELRQERGELIETIKTLKGRLSFYQNSNTPPSASSLEYKKRRGEERLARERGELPPRKPPGGRPGHQGTSRRHNPTETLDCRMTWTRCRCGTQTTPKNETRDIIDLVDGRAVEMRYRIEYRFCPSCGRVGCPDADLPATGSYGKRVMGIVAAMRAERLTEAAIARLLGALFGLRISVSAVSGIIRNVSDSVSSRAKSIMKKIKKAPHVHVDETSISNDGNLSWIWAFVYAKLRGRQTSQSRGGTVLDTHLDGYDGVVISDGFGPYRRFDPGGRYRQCRAHILRYVEHEALIRKGRLRGLHADLQRLYDIAKRASAAPSPQLRGEMESALDGILDGYADGDDADLDEAVKNIRRAAHNLFAFCEHAGVEPTNNPAERSLRDVVVRRKISGQIKGGAAGARRMSDFLTCIQTWRAQGKSVLEEVMRAV